MGEGECVKNGATNSGRNRGRRGCFYEGRRGLHLGVCWGIEVPLGHPGETESNLASVELHSWSGSHCGAQSCGILGRGEERSEED